LIKQASNQTSQHISITSDLSGIYEIIRSNPDNKIRKDAATHLLKFIEKDQDVNRDEIVSLFNSEKDIEIATLLKRALNKLQIRALFIEDPTSKYDSKLSLLEEEKILQEIERLKNLYDQSVKKIGAFEKRYKLIEKIADGGMGRVYKGIRLEDKQYVAIKYLLLNQLLENNNLDRERLIARFKREGGILRRLDHPHIVRGYEYGEVDGEYFLVMEYVSGVTVEELIVNKAIEWVIFKTISLQLCDVVAYIHNNGVIHRDIKPGNILVDHNSAPLQIKLADFGLSKDKRYSKLSKFSFHAGTDEYSSPQQLQDARDADERDDIFSMGKSFYHMLTGRTFENGEPYEEISKYNFTAPIEIDMIVKKCIELNKQDRFQNVAELRKSLENISHTIQMRENR
jgi:tRNA A-37 threonylcarbamoyl transferase component Bud32